MIGLHLASAFSALALGAIILVVQKGTPAHRALGRIWVALMLLTALSSFGITRDGSFSWIHLLSIWTLVALGCAVYFVRRGSVRAHRGFMVGTYLGLLGAGLGALAPGRLLHFFFFA